MGIGLSEDLLALAGVATSFAKARDLRGEHRGMLGERVDARPASWKAMADLDWVGIHLPEEIGGSGAGTTELAVLVEALAEAGAAGPFLAAAIGSAVLARIGDPTMLEGLADGSKLAAFAPESGLTRVRDRVSGTCSVLGGAWADRYVLVVGDDVAVVQAGTNGIAAAVAEGSLDAGTGTAIVALSQAPAHIIEGAAAAATAVARVLAAADASGTARATLTMAVEYARVRTQFGRTIGSFQAVKHHLADMLVSAERATAVAWDAASASANGGPQSELASASAAAVALAEAQRNAQMAIQVLGGIGFTWEHDAHLYLRHALAVAQLLGGVDRAYADAYRLTMAGVRREYSVDLPAEAERYRSEAGEFLDAFSVVAADKRRPMLVASGYLVPHWPSPWGRCAGPVEQLVLEEAFAGIDVPRLGIGGWVLLTLIQQASEEQVQRWVPASLAGELTWCQLFSEPGAGSDAAAVQTRAVKVDGGWRITGQKVWTSDAQTCNRGLATVRTDIDAPKHKGITAVAVDLHAEGVEVRPLREITGNAFFNEVFFNDLFVPDEDVVGEVNQGWAVARATLGNERVSIGGSLAMGHSATDLAHLHQRCREGETTLAGDIGKLVADEHAIRAMNLRRVTRAIVGAEPGVEGNLTKLLVALHGQHVGELALRVLEQRAADGSEPEWTTDYLMSRSLTIAGGTSEITRNVIAERLLGLPRDPLSR